MPETANAATDLLADVSFDDEKFPDAMGWRAKPVVLTPAPHTIVKNELHEMAAANHKPDVPSGDEDRPFTAHEPHEVDGVIECLLKRDGAVAVGSGWPGSRRGPPSPWRCGTL
jgi:hypothetical protein